MFAEFRGRPNIITLPDVRPSLTTYISVPKGRALQPSFFPFPMPGLELMVQASMQETGPATTQQDAPPPPAPAAQQEPAPAPPAAPLQEEEPAPPAAVPVADTANAENELPEETLPEGDSVNKAEPRDPAPAADAFEDLMDFTASGGSGRGKCRSAQLMDFFCSLWGREDSHWGFSDLVLGKIGSTRMATCLEVGVVDGRCLFACRGAGGQTLAIPAICPDLETVCPSLVQARRGRRGVFLGRSGATRKNLEI